MIVTDTINDNGEIREQIRRECVPNCSHVIPDPYLTESERLVFEQGGC